MTSDEQAAEHEQPVGREHAGGERGLGEVHDARRRSPRPISVPRPPTATQITASMEFAGANSLGLMMPTCGT